MKSVSVSLLCALICSSSGFVKRDVGGTVFRDGIEYVYKYETSVIAGTKDYLSFGSSFNITGTLRVQGGHSFLKMKLDDLKFGVYNGEYEFTPAPTVNMKEYAQLNPLMEPFHVTFENGKVNGIIVSADLPLWVQNIHRGIASGLQLDLTHINLKEATNFITTEHTIMGDCPTNYIVIPTHDEEPAQIRKFRSHSECTNTPTKIRKPGVTTYNCQTTTTRDVLNSSGATTWYVDEKDGHIVPKRIWIGSAVVYNVFGGKGHTQYSHHGSNLVLVKTNEGGYDKLAAPTNGKKHADVKYVFESEVAPNTDLTKPSPYFYHIKTADISHDSMMTIAQNLHTAIENLAGSLTNMEVYHDIKKFHSVSPFSIVPLVGSLDYDHLKECFAKYTKEMEAGDTKKITQWKIFLDAVVISGTGPAALLVRDIVAKTEDTRVIARVLAPFPNYVREPSDALVKEFETLLRKEKPTSIKTKLNARLIDFAFGSLLGRSCKKDLCKSSGLLEKYIHYFVNKFESAETFEEKTAVVGVLRNIGLEGALDKLVAIATDKEEEKSVRVTALGGVKIALRKYPTVLQDKILPIFFDRTEHVELRNLAGMVYIIGVGDQKVMKQMVMYMWVENCPQIRNFLKSFLQGVAASKRPCLINLRASATAALAFFPPWTVTRLYSENKFADYFDPEYEFGQMTHVSIQKTGKSALPNSIYVSLNGAIAGYGIPYLTFFVRMEGLGGALTNEIVKMSTGGAVNFDNIKDIYNKIGVVDREGTPLKLELIVALHNRIVSYNAVDSKSLQALPNLLKSLAEMKSTNEIEIHRMMLLGGIMVESPNEFGTPVSVISGVTAFGGINAKTNRGNAGTAVTSELDMRFQLHLFGTSMINNHMPAFNTLHSVSAHRTLRYRIPRKVTYGIDIKQQTLNFVVTMPKEEDPLMAMTHATAVTSVSSHLIAGTKDQKATELLKESCPECKERAIVSKGEDQRESRKLGTSEKIDLIEGIKSGVKYFDCERTHSRIHVYKMLKKYFGPANKNYNHCPATQVFLGLQYLRDSLFFSPVTQTCGMKAFFYQDKTQKVIFEKIEGSIKGKLDSDVGGKLGSKISIKSSLNMKYGGEKPKTRTVDVVFQFQTTGLEKKETKLKIVHHDGEAATNDVACLEVSRVSSKAPDFFSFEGESEPTHEKIMKLVYGRVEKKDPKDAACPKNAYEIKLVKRSRRSQGQKEEATSDVWPYKQCREAKNNDAKYPGKLTPATGECVWAAFKQTNLMESNITIDYKVDIEARRRWRRPGALIASVLMPYWVPSESKETHHEHAAQSDDGKFAQGQIKIDVVNDEPHPVADIHFHGSQGQDEHFHDIDLSILPKRPVFARFDPFFATAFELGFFGYCDVTPGAVQTFDNKTYFADMSDCNTLVSGDCSAKPKYAVLSRKSAADKIAITVLIADHKIEMENLNTAVVDGKEVKLTETVFTADEAKIFKMVKIDENNVYIVSMKFGIYIRYTGHYTTVTLGSRYRGTTCGVCGNYDFVKKNDFTGPDPTCKGIGPNEMMKAYIVRDGKCSGVGSTCPVSG